MPWILSSWHSERYLFLSSTVSFPMTQRLSTPLHALQLVLLATAVSLPTAASAQTGLPAYAPSKERYRLESNVKTAQTMMGQTQEATMASSQVSTMALVKSGAALSLTMTMDSASVTAAGPAPAPDMSAIIGSVFAGSMAADGQVSGSTVTDKAGKPMDGPAASSIRSFLPRLKVGAATGATWSDTSTTKGLVNGANVNTTRIVTYTVAGDTTVAGVRGWKITATNAGTIEGSGSQGGADFTMKGTIGGGGTYVISTTGIFLGAGLMDDVNMTVEVPMASMQIPITTSTTSKITRIP